MMQVLQSVHQLSIKRLEQQDVMLLLPALVC